MHTRGTPPLCYRCSLPASYLHVHRGTPPLCYRCSLPANYLHVHRGAPTSTKLDVASQPAIYMRTGAPKKYKFIDVASPASYLHVHRGDTTAMVFTLQNHISSDFQLLTRIILAWNFILVVTSSSPLSHLGPAHNHVRSLWHSCYGFWEHWVFHLSPIHESTMIMVA